LTPKHRKRSRTSAASGDTATSAGSQRLSLNGDPSAMNSEANCGPTASATVDDGRKRAGNCLESSALAAGDAISVNPLSVETQFSESPAGPVSGGSTTDTASEVASLIHSPGESSSVSTVDSSVDGKILRNVEDDMGEDHSQNCDSKANLDSRLAVAAKALACEDARSSVLSTTDNDHPSSVDAGDNIPFPDGDATDGETSQKLSGQKCPPRFSTKVSTATFFQTMPFPFHPTV